MAPATVERVHTASGETMCVRGDHLDLRWESDGELVFRDTVGAGSHIAGGLLLELAAPASGRVDKPGIVRCIPVGPVSEVEIIADAQGAGLRLTRCLASEQGRIEVGVTLCAYEATHGAVLRLTLHNVGAESVILRRLFPFVSGAWWRKASLTVAGRTKDFAIYKSGWQSW